MAKAPVSVDELVALVRMAIRNGTTHALPDLVGEWAHEAVKEVVRLHNELQAATETERKRCAEIARRHAERIDELCLDRLADDWDIADLIEKGVRQLRNPFLVTGPAVISFSGGRTSGMMLYKILEAHGGKLPADVLVCFCNTGKERPETLDFVEECSQRWAVPIVWLEYRCDKQSGPTFAVVNHATADRAGRVFESVIQTRGGASGFLPNPLARYCTIEMKILTLIRYLESLGWETWSNAIGFRADEPRRLAKARAGDSRDDRETPLFPLYHAGVIRADVMNFWAQQPFDLQLEIDEGNCDLCFLKGAGKLIRIMRGRPDLANWWIEQESRTGNRFRNDRPSYAALLEHSQRPGLFPLEILDDPDELSIACHCTD